MKLPDEFHQARIDLEVDFGEKGGQQRFKTVGDVDAWLNGEEEFWNWLKQSPASNHRQSIGEVLTQFWQGLTDCRNLLTNADPRWIQLRRQIRDLESQHVDPDRPQEARDSASREAEQRAEELRAQQEHLREALATRLKNVVVETKQYLPSTTPSAQFIKEIAAEHPDEAVYALDQILLENRGASQQRQVEHAGRMMAALYRKDLNRKVRPDQQAFKKAIETWTRELTEFKARYEAQEAEFQEISARHATADKAWAQRAEEMAEAFSAMRQEKEADLKNLRETFEVHMKLKGPMLYWTEKRDEHKKAKFWFGLASIICGAIGVVAIAVSAYLLFPKEGAANVIPWRNLGFFTLISTTVLWLVRILIKLMLSHIHLYADAREREVMISTFMALMRGEDGREGLTQLDLALVLAPIFKPSTTGVIKDDGGPTTLTDFISRLAGKT